MGLARQNLDSCTKMHKLNIILIRSRSDTQCSAKDVLLVWDSSGLAAKLDENFIAKASTMLWGESTTESHQYKLLGTLEVDTRYWNITKV